MSLNVNSVRAYERRRDFVTHYLYPVNKKKKPQIVCLQDTRGSEDREQSVLKSFQYDICFGHNDSTAVGGLITAFERKLDYKVCEHKYIKQDRGEMLVVKCLIMGVMHVIANVYIYPFKRVDELSEILRGFSKTVQSYECKRVLWCGDFNVALSKLDRNTPFKTNIDHEKARCLEAWTEMVDVSDIYRTLFPEGKRYTYISSRYLSRIDYFFGSAELMSIVQDMYVDNSFLSDHAPLYLDIATGRNPKGRNYWKFPTYLLQCNQYIDLLREEIPILIRRYEPDSNPQLCFDMVKLGIQQFTVKFIKNKDNLRREGIESREAEISEVEYEISNCAHSPDVRKALIKKRELLQKQYDEEFGKSWREYFIGRWNQCNEHSSKMFFQRMGGSAGAITKLFDDQNNACTSDSEILQVCHKFYSDLYKDNQMLEEDDAETVVYDNSKGEWNFNDTDSTVAYSEGDTPYCFIPDVSSHKLTPDNAASLDVPLTIQELKTSVFGMRKNKAPGIDGLPAEFYQCFFDDIKDLLFDSLKYAWDTGQLSCTQRRGIIKLLPKRNRNPHFVKNARPITLINIDVKILSRALALRLKTVIDPIMSRNQKAFIPGRRTGENILDVYSLISAAEECEEKDLLIFLDIEKAYDTVKWRFISTVLEKLNFPQSFIRWFEILQKNKELRIYNNGWSSAPVFTTKGVAQGSGLSPLIFIIAMSRLGDVIDMNSGIEGIQYANTCKKFGMAADDTMICTKATADNLSEVCNVMREFSEVSGLRVNFEKSVIVRIGKWQNPEEVIPCGDNFNFKWLHKAYYLGVWIDPNAQMSDVDSMFTFQTVDIDRDVADLRYDNRSVIGSILILKGLLASKLVYKFLHVPTPSKTQLCRINTAYHNFVWKNGRHKMNQKALQLPTSEGGFNMLNITIQQFALKVGWLSHLLCNVEELGFWEVFLKENTLIEVKDFLRCNLSKKTYHNVIKNSGRMLPLFWKLLFDEWFSRREIRPSGQWQDRLWKTGVLFNMWFGGIDYCASISAYGELKNKELFTCEEVAMVQDHLSYEDWWDIRDGYCSRRSVTKIHMFIQGSPPVVQDIAETMIQMPISTKAIYKHFVGLETIVPVKIIQAWERDLEDIVVDIWTDVCIRSDLIFNTKLKSFHILFLNRGYMYNARRSKFAAVEPECYLCEEQEETIIHLFWECSKVRPLWRKLIAFCEEFICCGQDVMNRVNCMLSYFSSELLVLIVTNFKWYIHVSKYLGTKPSWTEHVVWLKRLRDSEKRRAAYKKNLTHYERLWSCLTHDEIFEEL